KRAPNTLSTHYMPKNPGWQARETSGAPPMCPSTLSDGSLQSLYFPHNHPAYPSKFKSMAQILQERGFNVENLLAQCPGFKCKDWSTQAMCCYRRILFNQSDFCGQRSTIEELVEYRGHMVIFYPKFHCELNFIEQCWGYTKYHYRMMSKPGNSQQMEENIKNCLSFISFDLFRK
ncbi:uncharacterized protein FOMMEDRAFT_95586, partial [Fomitiporia mediterranea MF3/22]|uniref:uncharacterized protein n=1 Tax=Fomitiporia mediterranea (strain MF3/22) TaxID=694068 RepID=UPI000440740A